MKKYLTRGFTELWQWAKKHPLKALFTFAAFLVLFTLGLILEDGAQLFAVLIALAVGYGVWALVFTRDNRKLVIVALIGAASAQAQFQLAGDWPEVKNVTIVRTHIRDGLSYMVNYQYNAHGGGSIPATIPPGQMHYPCTVSVWQGGRQVGTNFSGEVTEKGCFEDKPEDMVAKALSQPGVIDPGQWLGWSLVFSNGFHGPYAVTKSSNGIAAYYRIDYSTNLISK